MYFTVTKYSRKIIFDLFDILTKRLFTLVGSTSIARVLRYNPSCRCSLIAMNRLRSTVLVGLKNWHCDFSRQIYTVIFRYNLCFVRTSVVYKTTVDPTILRWNFRLFQNFYLHSGFRIETLRKTVVCYSSSNAFRTLFVVRYRLS